MLAGLAAEISAERNVCLMDLPGYADKRHENPGTNIGALARRLIAEIPANSILLGWSMGGMIAIRIAHELRDRIRAIILLASTPCFVKKDGWPYGVEPSLVEDMAERIKANTSAVLQEFAGLTARGDIAPRQTLRALKPLLLAGAASPAVLLSGLDILLNADLRKEFSGLGCRMMMISGTGDQLVAPATASACHEIQPLLQPVNINHAGHAPFISGKREVVTAVRNFLRDVES